MADSQNVRQRTDLEKTYDAIFDEENGLKVRMETAEDDLLFVKALKATFYVVRWPLVPVLLAALAALGTWLGGLLWGK